MLHAEISGNGLQLCVKAISYQVFAYLQRADHFREFRLRHEQTAQTAESNEEEGNAERVLRWSVPMKLLLGVLSAGNRDAEIQLELTPGRLSLL